MSVVDRINEARNELARRQWQRYAEAERRHENLNLRDMDYEERLAVLEQEQANVVDYAMTVADQIAARRAAQVAARRETFDPRTPQQKKIDAAVDRIKRRKADLE
jgi:hypothetical protein